MWKQAILTRRNPVEERPSTVRAFIFQVLSHHTGRTIWPLCSSKHLNDPNGFMLLTNETGLICTHQSFMIQQLQRSHLRSQCERRRARRSAARDEIGGESSCLEFDSENEVDNNGVPMIELPTVRQKSRANDKRRTNLIVSSSERRCERSKGRSEEWR